MIEPDREICLKDGLYNFPDKEDNSFGWYQICESTFRHLQQILPEGKTILEFGSGWGTIQLARFWNVVSIEESENFKPAENDKIEWHHVPLRGKWYDTKQLVEVLPRDYDLIFVDGPSNAYENGRRGFYENLNLFRRDVPILFDDLHFFTVYNTFMNVALRFKRVPYLYPGDYTKSYGIIYAD